MNSKITEAVNTYLPHLITGGKGSCPLPTGGKFKKLADSLVLQSNKPLTKIRPSTRRHVLLLKVTLLLELLYACIATLSSYFVLAIAVS